MRVTIFPATFEAQTRVQRYLHENDIPYTAQVSFDGPDARRRISVEEIHFPALLLFADDIEGALDESYVREESNAAYG